mmetsp:Transcript_19427/g.39097  ORF Transcript_19427/g.39097 Transcript_19427/m.39097 type:complete len:171 (-) Transcript_19427:109-621(-)
MSGKQPVSEGGASLVEYEASLRRALELAKQAVEHGNHPFGALLLYDGKVILEAENTTSTETDKTRHAELNLTSKACKSFSPEVLGEAVLVTSTEPCLMCTGAIYWVGIRKVVFLTSHATLAKHAGYALLHECRQFLEKEGCVVSGPWPEGTPLADEGEKVHVDFWSKLNK